MRTPLDDVRDDTDIVWAQVEDDFFVGSVDGDFLGYIDRQNGGLYQVCDPYSRVIGHFTVLESAMRALEELRTELRPELRTESA